MSEPYIVEVWGKPAGVVVRDGNAYRFQALARPFFAIDGAQFTTPGHARLAAARLQFDDSRPPPNHTVLVGRSLGNASHWAKSLPWGS